VGNTGQTTNTEVCTTTKLDPTLRLFVSLRTGARKDLMRTMKKEMSAFRIHHDHVIYYKEQMQDLLAHLSQDEIVIKADFIQNIVHSRG
jgi:hypothetical protein